MSSIETPNINTNKLKVFYRRISTSSQNLQNQIVAEESFRKMYPEEEVLILEDLGISANKVKMEERPGLCKAIELIKSGEADTIFVYDRSRLARDFYEYLKMVDIFLKSNLSVNFTTNERYEPFSDSVLIEGMSAIMADEEGNNIARNTSNRNKRFPNAKFGYTVEGKKRKSYKVKAEYRFLIADLFNEMANRTSEEQVFFIVQKYQKLLNRKSLGDIFKMLCDPFYAGYELYTIDHFEALPHVEPVISLDLFTAVFRDGEHHTIKLQSIADELKSEVIMNPTCDKCDRKMIYRIDPAGEYSYFQCAREHKKRKVETSLLNMALVDSLKSVLSNLDMDRLRKECASYLSKLLKDTSMEIKEKETSLSKLHMKVALSDPNEQRRKLLHELAIQVKTLRSEINTLKTNVSLLKENALNVDYIIEEVNMKAAKGKTDRELLLLAPLFVKEVRVDAENNFLFSFYFNQYLSQNINTSFAS